MSSDADLAERLTAYLRSALSDPSLAVSGLRRLGGGSSRENWSFEAGGRPMLLRRDPVASVADTDRAMEVGLLRALDAAPFPTPIVLAADLSGRALDRAAVVMSRSAGRADRSVLRAKDPFGLGTEGRRSLAVALCDLLADVHTLDAAALGLPTVLGAAAADPAAREIERWETELDRVAVEPQPELALVALWLWEHRPPPPARVALVHADYRPANVLVDGGQVSVLLDWEFAHLGDPAEDLGWYGAPIYTREHFIDGAWSQADFLARYTERTGTVVELERLHFWQVLSMFKLAVILVAGIDSFLDGQTDRAAAANHDMLRATLAATRRR